MRATAAFTGPRGPKTELDDLDPEVDRSGVTGVTSTRVLEVGSDLRLKPVPAYSGPPAPPAEEHPDEAPAPPSRPTGPTPLSDVPELAPVEPGPAPTKRRPPRITEVPTNRR